MHSLPRSRYGAGIFFAALFVLFVACEPGGCSGCEGCGVTPIPGGFPLERRIPNSGQMRLTESGIAFVESNMEDIVGSFFPDGLSFAIPEGGDATAVICPQADECDACDDHECWADLEITSTRIDSVAPNLLRVVLRVRIQTRGLDVYYKDLEGSALCLWGDGPLCNLDVDSAGEAPNDQGLTADVVFTVDGRTGYTKVEIRDASLTEDLQSGDIDISSGGSCGLWCTIANWSFIKNLVIGSVQDQLAGQLTEPIQSALCRTCEDDSQCTGEISSCVDGVCEYPDGTCAPVLLGTEGRIDLGAMLASVTPGLSGSAQFTFTSGGDGEADGDGTDGLNLNFMGGFDALEHNDCVPELPPPDMPEIPLSEAVRSDTLPDGVTATMVNIGVAESYLDFAGFGIFDAGILCIGATPALSQQLSTGLFSFAIPSLDALAFPSEAAAVALQLRPQLPPRITVGEDPLLQVFLDDLMIDFYVFARDRYVRFMTVQLDMTIDLGLTVDAAGLEPDIQDVRVAEISVTNSRLLYDDAEDIADTFEAVLELAMDMFLGALDPIALPSVLGFELDIPEDGLTMTESGGERFLTVFANLSFDPEGAAETRFVPETSVTLERLDVDPEAFDLGEGWQDKRPVAHLRFGASAPVPVEWSHRIDGGTWSSWSEEPVVALAAPHFLFQGWHRVEVRARLAGAPKSADPTPAEVEFVIDTRPPRVVLEETESGYRAEASDIVTDGRALEYSWRVGDGRWSEWSGETEVAASHDAVVSVRVRDEAGNTAETSAGDVAAAGIIRGGPSTTGGGSCECRSAGSGGGRAPWVLGGLLVVLGLLGSRKRKGGAALLLVALVPFSLTAAGCDCGGDNGRDRDAGGDGGSCGESGCEADQVCCETSGVCMDVPELPCEPGFACADDLAALFDPETCEFPDECSDCRPLPPLEPGLIGSYTDFARADDGTIWVSGYAEGDVEGDPEDAWGDLVVGTWDDAPGEVDWETVDGVPADGEVVGAIDGWRGGIRAPGDDVGLYTSIALAADGSPRVTYYDRTNGALKFAALVGSAWRVQVVEDQADSGKYSSLVILDGDAPAVAYVQVRPDPGAPGAFVGAVRYAVGDGAVPTDWTIADVTTAPTPCRPSWCGDGEVCTVDGTCEEEGGACDPECASGEACIAGACQAVLDDGWVEDWPPGFGHTSLAIDPTTDRPVVAAYYRTEGNLLLSELDGGAWTAPTVIAGFADDVDTCDCGLFVSLVVDGSGVRHATYVDGWSEALRYWSSTGADEEVDHRGGGLLGDDSSLLVTPGGEVRVAYGDSTEGSVKFALRGGPDDWTTETLDGPGEEEWSGFHVEQMWDGAQSLVGTWWVNYQTVPVSAGVKVIAR